jgi:hypothetical protein
VRPEPYRSQLRAGDHHTLISRPSTTARESRSAARSACRALNLRARLDDAAADELRVVAASANAFAERQQDAAAGHALPILGILGIR